MINTSNGDDWDDGPTIILRNSTFTHNEAIRDNGGVVNVGSYGFLLVEGGDNVFAFNKVVESGGVFAATADTMIVIEGGEFHDNEADKVRSITLQYRVQYGSDIGGMLHTTYLSATGTV